MTSVVEKDVNGAIHVINGSIDGDYGRIYARSNENLKKLFRNISVDGKDVLTVLSSGDQFLYSYYNGANSVDTFDSNKLTKYYYYIRKWSIEYFDEFYPEIDSDFQSYVYFRELLDEVKCQTEEEKEAYDFWNGYLKSVCKSLSNRLYFKSFNGGNYLSDMRRVRNIVLNKDLSFYHQDLSGKINKDKKYDVIIVSNILEYLSKNPIKLAKCRDNLYDVLKDDGVVICSRLIDCLPRRTDEEKFTFNKRFNCEELVDRQQVMSFNKNISMGYVYTKKR